jgi:uncharacterized protein YcnI
MRRRPIAVRRTAAAALFAAATVAAIVPAAASAHAEISPPVSLSDHLQLYSLVVPTERENATTTKIVLSVPSGFAIDSFGSSPGWQRTVQQSGSGESAVIQKVTWTGGHTPTGEDSVFQFLAQPSSDKTYSFTVQQTYSDGSIVDWSGSESSDTPAPTIEVKSSLGGGGGGLSALSLVALIVAVIALAVAIVAMTGSRRGEGGRPVA